MRGQGLLLDKLTPEQVRLRFTERPHVQSQDETWSIDPRTLRDYDLFICLSGAARFTIGAQSFDVSEKQALLVPPQTKFSAHLLGDRSFDAIAQHFTLDILGHHDLFDLIQYRPHVSFGHRWVRVRDHVRSYVELHRMNTRPMAQHALFLLVLSEFLDLAYIAEKQPQSTPDMSVVEMSHYLLTHYAQPDALEHALSLSPYSKDYANRVFKKYMGTTPKQFLIAQRFRIARELLQQGYAVKDTAHTIGYRDELYFSRLFRRKMGTVPSAYRHRV